MSSSRLVAKNPLQSVPDCWPELPKLDSVDEGVQGGVGVAKPKHEAGPPGREGYLKVKEYDNYNLVL